MYSCRLIFFWLAALSQVLPAAFCTETDTSRYAIVIDAGSTGSRSYVVRAVISGEDRVFSATPGGKIKPGLSSFANELANMSTYLYPLIEDAIRSIPDSYDKDTELHIRGTGGMRLLGLNQQIEIWDGLFDQLLVRGFPLSLKRSNFGTISGFELFL